MLNNFFDPAILFFIFGIVAGLIKSNLEIPQQISKFLSLYLPLLTEGGMAVIEDVQSPDWFNTLKQHVPEEFTFEEIDLRGIKGRYDDLVFAVTK